MGFIFVVGMVVVLLFFGVVFLISIFWEWEIFGIGYMEFVILIIFDIGVYFVVIGFVFDVLCSFGVEVDC